MSMMLVEALALGTVGVASDIPGNTTVLLARRDVQAAVLGTPAWSIYAGKLAAVDRTLVAAGSLSLIHDADDLARIPLRKKPASKPPHIGDALVVQFVDRLLAVARQ